MSVNVGVLGCGSIGRRYVGWLSQLGCEVGVFDTDRTKTSDIGSSSIQVFDDMHTLIAWAQDFLVIATPPRHHCAPLMAALNGKARIMVEKPLAASLVEACEMRLAAERFPGRLFGVCNMRFHPAVRAMRMGLSGIGKPLYARAHFSHRLAQMRPAGLSVFAADAKEGGGVILDCVHDIDLLVWMLGPMQLSNSWTGRIGPDPITAEDYAEIQFLCDQGTRICLHLDFLARWKRRGCEIAGTEATLLWQSEGRRPESATVYLNHMDAPSLIFESDAVDSNVMYLDMLRSFLSDAQDLQTLQEAEDVLQLAYAAGAVLQ